MRGAVSHLRAAGAVRAAAILSLALLAAFPASAAAQGADKKRRDADVKRYLGQLAARFKAWDVNNDGKLDKQELAWAFRGKDANPYDYDPLTPRQQALVIYRALLSMPPLPSGANLVVAALVEMRAPEASPSVAPDPNVLPDYQFLVLAGTTGNDFLTRKEFDAWARTYAQTVAGKDYSQRLYQNAVRKGQNAAKKFQKAKNQKAKKAALAEGQAAQADAQRYTQDYQTAAAQPSAIPAAIHQTLALK